MFARCLHGRARLSKKALSATASCRPGGARSQRCAPQIVRSWIHSPARVWHTRAKYEPCRLGAARTRGTPRRILRASLCAFYLKSRCLQVMTLSQAPPQSPPPKDGIFLLSRGSPARSYSSRPAGSLYANSGPGRRGDAVQARVYLHRGRRQYTWSTSPPTPHMTELRFSAECTVSQ